MENLLQSSSQSLAARNPNGQAIICKNNFSFDGNLGPITYNINAPAMSATMGFPVNLRRDCYNLFVVSEPLFNARQFAIPRQVCLRDGTTKTAQMKYRNFTEETKAEIAVMPSLLLAKNETYRKPGEAQTAYFGHVHCLNVLDKSVAFSFNSLIPMQQSPLLELLDGLCIAHTEFISELDKPRWSIKHADLIGILTNAYLLDKIFDLRYPKK